MEPRTPDSKRFLDFYQTQRILNRKIWKNVTTKHQEELEEFELLEKELLQCTTDAEDSLEIDLPSLTIEQRWSNGNVIPESLSPIPSGPTSHREITSKLVQKLFPKAEKTANGVPLKTEVTAYRSRITVLFDNLRNLN
jgi:hypothetical protein